jgi:hypothetical protein
MVDCWHCAVRNAVLMWKKRRYSNRREKEAYGVTKGKLYLT